MQKYRFFVCQSHRPFPGATPAVNVATLTKSGPDLKSGRFFEEVAAALRQDSSLVSKVRAVVGFTVSMDTNETVSYVVDLKKAPGAVFVNDGKTPTECDIAISDEHLSQVLAYIF